MTDVIQFPTAQRPSASPVPIAVFSDLTLTHLQTEVFLRALDMTAGANEGEARRLRKLHEKLLAALPAGLDWEAFMQTPGFPAELQTKPLKIQLTKTDLTTMRQIISKGLDKGTYTAIGSRWLLGIDDIICKALGVTAEEES